ncbi:MAG: 6-carboxytetrahydropterin synthase [Chloroflexi bacterium]|nr:6-carboxytetrahydropterin synthase [Chloroflexota bacterium]
MYSVAVKQHFIAQHYLVGGDWGAENLRHSHHYVVEALLEGPELDRHDYLVDIVAVEGALSELADYYRDRTLNDLPGMAGHNPSLELLAAAICRALVARLRQPSLAAIAVKVWESDSAWAGYRLPLAAAQG